MQVIDPSNKQVSKVFGLVYGASGTGKTHLMGTLGELGKVLLIDIDKGYNTIVHAPDIPPQVKDNVVITTFDKFGDLNVAYRLVEKNDPGMWMRTLDPKGEYGLQLDQPFDWIVWDTWSELQWFMLQELRKNENLLSPNMGKDINFRKNIGIQHWGMLTDLNKLAVEQLRECNVSQFFTMQEKLDKDELLGTIYGGPAIHGKMVQEMPTYFDIVVHTSTDPQGKFCATTKAKTRWPAKTRFGVGQDFVNPTMKQILEV